MATTSSNANGAPLSKTESYSASKSAMAAIFGSDHKYAKDAKEASTQSSAAAVSSTSPTSAPPDARAQSGVEPPSGIQGAGTATEPYDQGNAPENVAEQTPKTVVNGGSTTTQSKTEPLSGVQGKGTQDEPFDQGNSNEATAANQPINTTVQQPPASTPAAPAQTKSQAPKAEESHSRGRTLAPPSSGADRNERSVSPGTLADGSHETCSGERGEGYTPGGGLGRLKGKLGFGKS